MPTYNANLLPTATGLDLGSDAQRWDAYIAALDVSGDSSFSSVLSAVIKNLNAVRFADQYGGLTPGDSISAAGTEAGANGVVVAPFGMAAGDPTSLPSGCYCLDLRSGKKVRLFVGTGATIREVLSFGTNLGGDNPFGRLQVYSEIGATPNTNGIPLGNDLALIAEASADLRLKCHPLDLTCSTSVTAGTRTVTVPSTANLYTAANLVIEPDGANEETVLSGSWSILSSTTLSIVFTKSHTASYTIRQIGSVDIDARTVGLNRADSSGKNVAFLERNNNPVVTFPNDTSAAWPNGGVQCNAQITGANGTNKDLIFRNNTTASSFYILNKNNNGTLFQVAESGGSSVLKLGNPTNQSLQIQGSADIPRILGGGTSGGMGIYGSQGGTGTGGTIRFRNNATDESDKFTVNTSTGAATFAGAVSGITTLDASGALTAGTAAIGGGTVLTKAVVYSQALTPASVAAASAAEQTFTVSGLTTADKVFINPPAPTNSAIPVAVRVSAADTLAITFQNVTAGALTPTAGTYKIVAIRS